MNGCLLLVPVSVASFSRVHICHMECVHLELTLPNVTQSLGSHPDPCPDSRADTHHALAIICLLVGQDIPSGQS